MEALKWVESFLLAFAIILILVVIGISVEVTRGLALLVIAAVWVLAAGIKKSMAHTKKKKERK